MFLTILISIKHIFTQLSKQPWS